MVSRIFLLLLVCSLTTAAIAQPVLTSATNNPVAGDTFYIYNFTDLIGMTAGASGAAVSWDYSAPPATILDTIKYISSTGTPYTDSFPGCGLSHRFLVPGYGYSGYDYFSTDTAGFSNHGNFKPGSGTGYYKWDIPYKTFYYPLSYTSTYLDSGVNYAYGAKIVSNFTCDGYGTLKLPDGTHNNVLRLHKVNIVHYSPTYSVRNENYIWVTAGFHHELFWLNVDTTGGGSHVSSAYYSTSKPTPALVQDMYRTSINIYPNPATSTLHIDVTNEAEYNYLILDCLGRTVITKNHAKSPETIDLSTLPHGVYYIKVLGDNHTEGKQFVKM